MNGEQTGTIRITVGADKGYDTEDFINELRTMNATPHVAAKAKRVGYRRPSHAACRLRHQQRIRKRIEEEFGWSKTVALAAKTMLRGVERFGADRCPY